MIRSYNEHSANERTFLAWIRTGVAIIAFGVVIEKVDLYVDTISVPARAGESHLLANGLSGLFGKYDGAALICLGLVLMVIQAARFERTRRQLDDDIIHAAGGMKLEWVFVTLLVALVVAFLVNLQGRPV